MSAFLQPLAAGPWASLIQALLHTLWQGALAVALLALALRSLPAGRPNARYAAALAALAFVVLSGAATWGLLEFNRRSSGAAPFEAISVDHSSETSAAYVPAIIPAAPLERAPLPWTAWAAALWLAGALAMLARVAWLVAEAGRDRRACRPLGDPAIEERFAALRTALRVARRVRLLISERIDAPAAAGLIWPVILLPASMLTGVPREQLEAILAHELAHIRRHDYLIHLLQLVVEALLFFNPAVWWISRQMRVEREACCDALAAGVLGRRFGYARALTDVAARLRPASAGAQAAQLLDGDANRGEFLDRVRRIVLPYHRPRLRLPFISLIVSMLIGAGILAALWQGTEAVIAGAAGEKSGEESAAIGDRSGSAQSGIRDLDFSGDSRTISPDGNRIEIRGNAEVRTNSGVTKGESITIERGAAPIAAAVEPREAPQSVSHSPDTDGIRAPGRWWPDMAVKTDGIAHATSGRDGATFEISGNVQAVSPRFAIEASRLSIDAKTGLLQADGATNRPARMRYANREVTGDAISMMPGANSAQITGNVKLMDDNGTLTAERLVIVMEPDKVAEDAARSERDGSKTTPSRMLAP